MSKMINTTTALVDCLADNNRYASKKLTADQIGAENLSTWKALISKLHSECYYIYCKCENDNLAEETKNLDMSGVYDAIRVILAEIGEVNGHAIRANAELATLLVGYSGKRGNQDAPALQLCTSRINNRKKELKLLEATNGANPDAIAHVKEEIAALEAEKSELLASPDMRIKAPTRASSEAFRLDVEHRFARVISDQKAKTWEELEAEVQARKDAKKAAKKAAKKNASK